MPVATAAEAKDRVAAILEKVEDVKSFCKKKGIDSGWERCSWF